MKTLVLEKYRLKVGQTTPCPTCGGTWKHPAMVHVRGWHRTCAPGGKAGVATEYGAGETGLIMAGHAADDAIKEGTDVHYRGKWTRREKHGPWSVNAAMRGE